MAFLSIVSPVYNTGKMTAELVQRLSAVAQSITDDFEIVLVDDASPDKSWKLVEEVAAVNKKVVAVKLSRNFGQHAAITAGLAHSNGDWVVVMDSDLQDVPEEISNLYKKAQEGYDIVIARRHSRDDPFFRKIASKCFSSLLTWLSGIKSDHAVANFGIYKRQVIAEVLAMKELHRFFPMMINWVGFNKTTIECTHAARPEGKSGYNFEKLFKLALNTTMAYSDKPLRYVVKIGFLISAITFVIGLITLIRYFSGSIIVLGYTSLILSIWFMGGIILFTLGMVGLYVGKTFEEVKKRPLYIVEKTMNI